MGKGIRVKCIVMLILVMGVIYTQQPESAYARAEKKTYNTNPQVLAGREAVKTVSTIKAVDEGVSENVSETTVGKADTGESDTGKPEAGETDEGKSDTEEPGGEKPDSGGEEPDSGEKEPDSGEKEPDVGEEEPDPGEETPPVEEPEKEMLKYELQMPEANGKNGYYTEKPKIKICHVSETGITKYMLKKGEEILAKGVLKEKDEKVVIEEEAFAEGKHSLHIYMEDEEGESQEKEEKKYEEKREILIDTKKPQVYMNAPRGFDAWYQDTVPVSVRGDDGGSGISKISCFAGGETPQSVEKENGIFPVSKASVLQRGVSVTVIVQDRAGNKSEQTKTVYIDREAPKVVITGVKDYTVTAKDVVLGGIVEEENALKNLNLEIVREDENGKKKKISASEWKTEGTKKVSSCRLKNNGLYEIKIIAEDMTGHCTSQTRQIIIDKTNPVIRYLDTLDGKYLKKFRWNYEPQQMIRDFTTYTYDMRLDGQLYRIGKTVYTEGTHKLTVKAMDAAGNHTRAEAEFVIDHTAPEILFKNIEEGETYEEERTFTVGLRGETDTIRQIQINGEAQPLDVRKRTYEYTLHDCQDYEIAVEACDKAGNQAKKTIYFKIEPEKTLVEKLTEPVKNYFQKDEEKNISEDGRSSVKEEKKTPLGVRVVRVSALCVLLISAGYIFRKKCRTESEEETQGQK